MNAITAWPYGILTEEGKMFDIDDEDLDRWYVLP